VTYKDQDGVYSVSYTDKGDAEGAKQMVLDSHGSELINGDGSIAGIEEIEWCHLTYSKLWG
jgi:hypothetical protein